MRHFPLTFHFQLFTFYFACALLSAQDRPFVPVTSQMLVNPSPDDWLMYSRTYDAQRFSPLKDITRQNVGTLTSAWTKPMPAGTLESIPIVYRGVMYVALPGATVWALDASNGSLIWEYKRDTPTQSRTKTLANLWSCKLRPSSCDQFDGRSPGPA